MMTYQKIVSSLHKQVSADKDFLFEVYIPRVDFCELVRMWRGGDSGYHKRLHELAKLVQLDDVPEAYMKLARLYMSQDPSVLFYDVLHTHAILDQLVDPWSPDPVVLPPDDVIKKHLLVFLKASCM